MSYEKRRLRAFFLCEPTCVAHSFNSNNRFGAYQCWSSAYRTSALLASLSRWLYSTTCTIVKQRQDCVTLCVCVCVSRRNTGTGAQSFTQALLSITFVVCEIMAHPRSLETWVNIFYVLQIVHLLMVTIWVVVLARLFIVRLAHASAPPCPALPWW